tara:strand:- start:68 stop:595 length:528 start_codon:yes stop_codon:yes gene_type:complete
MILVIEAFISLVILAVKDVWAMLYTSDTRVVRLVSQLLIPLAIYTAFDGVLCVATGTIKACGKQWVAGPVVLFSYYLIGIPLAYWLSFTKGQGAMGLAIGATVGTMLHSVLIIAVVWRTDWPEEARRAAERVGEKSDAFEEVKCEKASNVELETLLPPVAEVELTDVESKVVVVD